MSPEFDKTLDNLNQTYNVKGQFRLSKFYQPDGKKHLYNWLRSIYQPVYENLDRIVIIQDCVDSYQYDDLPGSAVTCLQQYLAKIDISNFFVILITTNNNVARELELVQQLYSTDSTAIQHILIDGQYIKNIENSKDTFCALPWMHLYVGPDANVLPCCQADHQYPMGNLQVDTLKNIVNSKEFVALRRNMLLGKKSKECKTCYTQEDANLVSRRISNNRKWKIIPEECNQDGTVDMFLPKYLDIRLNNICNLKCRMCSDYFSSSIAQENYQLYKTKLPVLNNLQKTNLLSDVMELLPYTEQIYFAGGEPLLTTEHYQILQKLIDSGHTKINLSYNTNFTTLQYKDISVLDLWKKFSRVRVGASLDAHGSVAEYVRHGSKWSQIEKNLANLKQECPHVEFLITSVVGFLNIESLIELQKTWHTKKIISLGSFSLSTMVSPEYLTVQVLPDNQKKRLATIIKEHIDWCQKEGGLGLANQWKNVLNYMLENDNSHHLNTFQKITTTLDKHRGESFVDVFPQYREILLQTKGLNDA